jgi:hypothetical protein
MQIKGTIFLHHHHHLVTTFNLCDGWPVEFRRLDSKAKSSAWWGEEWGMPWRRGMGDSLPTRPPALYPKLIPLHVSSQLLNLSTFQFFFWLILNFIHICMVCTEILASLFPIFRRSILCLWLLLKLAQHKPCKWRVLETPRGVLSLGETYA